MVVVKQIQNKTGYKKASDIVSLDPCTLLFFWLDFWEIDICKTKSRVVMLIVLNRVRPKH